MALGVIWRTKIVLMLTSYRLVCFYFHSPTEDTMNLWLLIPHTTFYRIHRRTVMFKLTHLTEVPSRTHTQHYFTTNIRRVWRYEI